MGRQAVASVERDDSRFVNQFLKDDHVARRLEDLRVAAVVAPDAVPSPRDAARPDRQVGVAVGRPPRGAFGPRGGQPLLGLGCVRWHSPVRRVDDERGPAQALAAIEPERVVGARVARGRRTVGPRDIGGFEALSLLLAQGLLAGQRASPRPLERRRGLAVPLTLEVGVPPRRSGRDVLGPRRRPWRCRPGACPVNGADIHHASVTTAPATPIDASTVLRMNYLVVPVMDGSETRGPMAASCSGARTSTLPRTRHTCIP